MTLLTGSKVMFPLGWILCNKFDSAVRIIGDVYVGIDTRE